MVNHCLVNVGKKYVLACCFFSIILWSRAACLISNLAPVAGKLVINDVSEKEEA